MSISNTKFGPLTEAMGTDYCEEAHRRTIKKLDVDGKYTRKRSISPKWIGCLAMRVILIAANKEETSDREIQVILTRKTQGK